MDNYLNNNYLHKQSPYSTPCTTLYLRQIKGFEPPKQMRINESVWTLRKDARDSSVDIPNPQQIQWIGGDIVQCHNASSETYIYYAYGIKQPRANTYEKPVNVLFVWFNDKQVAQFNPSIISDSDWMRANVYTSPCVYFGEMLRNAYLGIEKPLNVIPSTETKPDMEVTFSNQSESKIDKEKQQIVKQDDKLSITNSQKSKVLSNGTERNK